MNATTAPIDSPAKEIKRPSQNPKNKMFAAVRKTLGSIPALLLEGYSSYQVMEFGWQGKLILTIIAVALIIYTLRNTVYSKKRDE